MSKRGRTYTPVDLSRVKRCHIDRRAHKTEIASFGRPMRSTAGAKAFLASLPDFLRATDLRLFIEAVISARKSGKPFHLLLGAHTIKVGLSPVLIDLMNSGLVTGMSFNGAGLIHDLELAFFGGTSEDVQKGLTDGSFGMVKETAELFGAVTEFASAKHVGLGKACGAYINSRKAKHRRFSVFAACDRLNLPITVHVGIGTDIVSQHPEFDAARVAAASHLDFRILAAICADIDSGGVVANIGSAVILPEVFLKALTVARNLKKTKSRLTTANFDMIEHYRPRVNVVSRPTLGAGRGFSFVGHHEIMVPLLAWGLKAKAAGLR